MGYIELSDGIGNRRIHVPELTRPIRIELDGSDAPRVVVPEGTTVKTHRPHGPPGSGRPAGILY